jgi:hypothetical protein
MDTAPRNDPLTDRPIARQILARMKARKRGKAAGIASLFNPGATEALHRDITSREEFASLDPGFAAYLYPQIQLSLISEQLSTLKEMAPLADMVSQAEDLYMPEGPPMSPLTRSYFTGWALFDACVGEARETIGTTILEIGAALGMHADLLRLIRLMQDSRMGFYIHRGKEGKLTVLEDIITGAVCRATLTSGDCGNKGELWYARVLPPPIPGCPEVVFTTPYVLAQPQLPEWRKYFRRAVPGAGPGDYERHVKYGPTRDYWNEFIFEGYMNHRPEAIYLAGLPDIPESRPHSRVSEENGWNPGFIGG